jgi:hypothetical protein
MVAVPSERRLRQESGLITVDKPSGWLCVRIDASAEGAWKEKFFLAERNTRQLFAASLHHPQGDSHELPSFTAE